MDHVLRSFNATIDDVNSSDRSIVAKVGVGSVDRYNTVICPSGIDLRAFTANPVVLFSHGKDPLRGELPVGRCLWVRVEKTGNGRLIAKTRFGKDEFSQTLYDLYADGSMRGWSVSILPKDFGKPTQAEIRARPDIRDIDCIFRTSELIEYSCTSTPGQAEALTLDEMRSLSKVISRGIPVPIDIKSLVEKAMTEGSGLATGGALVEPETVDEACDPKDKPKKRKKPKSDDDADDDDDEDDDEPETVDEGGITITGGGMAPTGLSLEGADVVERTTPEAAVTPEPESVIELPPLTGRTFESIVASHILEERHFRHELLRQIQEYREWLAGKA